MRKESEREIESEWYEEDSDCVRVHGYGQGTTTEEEGSALLPPRKGNMFCNKINNIFNTKSS